MYSDDQKQEHIKELQLYLKTIAAVDKDIPNIAINGVYNSETKTAVITYQKERGLPVTGVVDSLTWNVLVSEYTNIIRKYSPPMNLAAFPAYNYTISPGDIGGLVYVVQNMIEAIAPHFSNIAPVPLTGIYDKDTVAEIKKIQSISGLGTTGVIDKQTWDALANLYNIYAYRTPIHWLAEEDAQNEEIK